MPSARTGAVCGRRHDGRKQHRKKKRNEPAATCEFHGNTTIESAWCRSTGAMSVECGGCVRATSRKTSHHQTFGHQCDASCHGVEKPPAELKSDDRGRSASRRAVSNDRSAAAPQIVSSPPAHFGFVQRVHSFGERVGGLLFRKCSRSRFVRWGLSRRRSWLLILTSNPRFRPAPRLEAADWHSLSRLLRL